MAILKFRRGAGSPDTTRAKGATPANDALLAKGVVPAAGPTSPAAGTCRNCGATAPGAYCPACGQETRVALPKFREFMRDAMGRLVGFDGRLWRTLFGLVFRPGFLSREYFAGRRKRYIRPARIFLVMSLLLFAVVGIVESPADLAGDFVVVNSSDDDSVAPLAIRKGETNEEAERRRATIAKAVADAKAKRAAVTEGAGTTAPGMTVGVDDELNLTIAGFETALPPVLKKRFIRFKEMSREGKAAQLYAGLLRYGPYAIFALLPAFALLLKLSYLGRAGRYPNRPHYYAEHLVYSAHLHAFAFLMLILFVVFPYPVIRIALALWFVFYVIRGRSVVYGGRWWAGVLRAFIIAIIYTALVTFAIIGLLALAVLLR